MSTRSEGHNGWTRRLLFQLVWCERDRMSHEQRGHHMVSTALKSGQFNNLDPHGAGGQGGDLLVHPVCSAQAHARAPDRTLLAYRSLWMLMSHSVIVLQVIWWVLADAVLGKAGNLLVSISCLPPQGLPGGTKLGCRYQ